MRFAFLLIAILAPGAALADPSGAAVLLENSDLDAAFAEFQNRFGNWPSLMLLGFGPMLIAIVIASAGTRDQSLGVRLFANFVCGGVGLFVGLVAVPFALTAFIAYQDGPRQETRVGQSKSADLPSARASSDKFDPFAPSDIMDLRRLIASIRAGDWDTAEDLGSEPALHRGFADTSPDLAAHLDAWVSARPASNAALGLRAKYLINVGRQRRGGLYARDTPPERFAAMREAYGKASLDLFNLLARDPTRATAHEDRLLLLYTGGHGDQVTSAYETAVRHGAESTDLVRIHLGALEPRWSRYSKQEAEERSEDLIRDVKRRAPPNVDVDRLEALRSARTAESLWERGQRDQAIGFMAQLVERPGGHWQTFNLAHYLERADRDEDAVEQYRRYLEVDPLMGEAYHRLAGLFRDRGDLEEALHLSDLALTLEPYDGRFLIRRGHILRRLGRIDEARADFEATLVYEDWKPGGHSGLGWIDLYYTNDYAAAAVHFARAVERDADRASDVFHHAMSLEYARDCKAMPAFQTYLEECAGLLECSSDHLRKAQEAVAHMSGICTEDGKRR